MKSTNARIGIEKKLMEMNKGKMRMAIFGTVIVAALLFATSMAFAGCGDCQIRGVEVYTEYSGSGEYCLQTTVPAGENTYYTDSVGASAEHYEGYQYVYSDGSYGYSYDSASVEGGSLMTSQRSYYNDGVQELVTTYTTCITSGGQLGALVYVSEKSGYGYQAATGPGFVCVEFSQLNYLDGNFDYYIETGAASYLNGEVSSMTYFYPEGQVWGTDYTSSEDGLLWIETETTESVDLCTDMMTEFMTNTVELNNTGHATYISTAGVEGNATFEYGASLNPRRTTTTTSTTTTVEETTTTSTTVCED